MQRIELPAGLARSWIGRSRGVVTAWRSRTARDRALDCAVVSLLLVNLMLMAYYIARGYVPDFHSDAAVKNLLAQEIWETGTFFPPEWNYVNDDLWIVFGQLFVLPALPFFANGYGLHAFSGFVSASLILWSVWLVSSLLTSSVRLRTFALALISGSVSALGAENLFGQVSYGSILCIACFLVYLAWKTLTVSQRVGVWGAGLLALCLLVFWSNPQRAAATYFVPLCAALVCAICQPAQESCAPNSARSVYCIFLIALGSLLGILLHQWTLSRVISNAGAGSALWLGFDQMSQKAVQTFQGLLAILGGIPTTGGSVTSKGGLFEGGRMLVALVTLSLIPWAAWRSIHSEKPGVRFLAGFSFSALAIFVILQATTSTSDMSDPVTSARYMLPALLMCILVFVGLLSEARTASQRSVALATVPILVVLALPFTSPTHPYLRALRSTAQSDRIELASVLRENKLAYGYATFWNAGVMSVLSGQRTRVRQVLLQNGLPVPYRHLASNRWYRSNFWVGETFLLLADKEYDEVDWGRIERYVGKPTRVIRAGRYAIVVYPSNLAALLPNWGTSDFLDLLAQDEPRHTVGEVVTIDGATEMRVAKGTEGYLHYGPYLQLRSGRYRVLADIDVDSAPAGVLDVVASNGSLVLGTAGIDKVGENRMKLEFGLSRGASGLEVRVYTTGAGMRLRKLTLERL